MSGLFAGMLGPTPHYYTVQGRAAEIARSMGAGRAGTEHLFLAMLHDGGWPVSLLTGAGIIDADRAENAVVAAITAPGYAPPASAAGSLAGARTAADLGDSYIGVEHAILEIIGNRAGVVPAALAGLANLDEAEAAVLAAKNAPPRAPDDAVLLPDGQVLDSALLAALTERVPAGASFGFNALGGRAWIRVWGDGVDGGVGRAVLDAALTAVGRR